MFKFLTQKILDWKLRKLPEGEREMIKGLMAANPKLFEAISKDIAAKKKAGIPEQAAAMQAFFARKNEIAQTFKSAGIQPPRR